MSSWPLSSRWRFCCSPHRTSGASRHRSWSPPAHLCSSSNWPSRRSCVRRQGPTQRWAADLDVVLGVLRHVLCPVFVRVRPAQESNRRFLVFGRAIRVSALGTEDLPEAIVFPFRMPTAVSIVTPSKFEPSCVRKVVVLVGRPSSRTRLGLEGSVAEPHRKIACTADYYGRSICWPSSAERTRPIIGRGSPPFRAAHRIRSDF
jgi:hypothetical protein